METNLTASIIKRASYAMLSQLCIQLDVEFKNQPKEKLQELLLAKFKSFGTPNSNSEEKEATEISSTSLKPDLNKSKSGAGNKTAKKIIHTKPTPIRKVNNTRKAAPEKTETKSSKILALYLKGRKVSEISKELKAHPSFCYTIIGKHKSKAK